MKPEEKKGKVVRKPFGKGTKSEHEAVMLVTKQGEYKLRRQDGNPFHDPELEKLVGKTIRCDGIEHDYTFVMSKYDETKGDDIGVDDRKTKGKSGTKSSSKSKKKKSRVTAKSQKKKKSKDIEKTQKQAKSKGSLKSQKQAKPKGKSGCGDNQEKGK